MAADRAADRAPTIAVIPARGGSRSIPHKNLAPLGGRPLLAWSIDVARRVPAIDRILVSTDDEAIAAAARAHGAEVSVRPAHLADDRARVIDALRDLLARLAAQGTHPRVLVLLEPTCPLREPADVEACLARLEDDDVDAVATFAPARVHPLRTWRLEDGRPRTYLPDVDPWAPRQQLPPAYQLNGGVYAFRADRFGPDAPSILFGRTAAVPMPEERSVDIDGPIDLLVAQALLDARRSA